MAERPSFKPIREVGPKRNMLVAQFVLSSRDRVDGHECRAGRLDLCGNVEAAEIGESVADHLDADGQAIRAAVRNDSGGETEEDGRVIALDTPQGLIDGLGMRSVVRFTTAEPDLSWVEQLDVVDSLTRVGDAVEIRGTGPVLALVAHELVAHGIVPIDLRLDRPSVEDAFLALTGRSVRG